MRSLPNRRRSRKKIPANLLQGVKQAQANDQKKLKAIITDKQLASFNALRESIIMDMMKDLAEL
jgi:hypothetical protein